MSLITKCQCGYEYGVWRYQCPACGTHNSHRAAAMQTSERAERVARAVTRRVKKLVLARLPKHPCVLCQKGHASKMCPHCNERAHPGCLELHRELCLKFQLEREAILDKLKREERA